MKVGILGWYGHNNIGDDAMLEGLQYLFSKHFNVKDFVVMSNTTTEKYPPFHPDLANTSDLMVWGGGEIIYPHHMFVSIEPWTNLVHPTKIIIGCGVNAPDYEAFLDPIKQGLQNFSYIGVRDAIAYGILNEDPVLRPKLALTLDPSMVLVEKYNIKAVFEKGTTVVVPTDRVDNRLDAGIIHPNIIERTKDKLKSKLLEDGMTRVKLVALGKEDNDDVASCRKLEEYFHPELETELCEPKTPKETLEVMSKCERVYAYRLHGLIFAHMLNVPYGFFNYHHKVGRVHYTIRNRSPNDILRIIDQSWSDLRVRLDGGEVLG